MQTFFTISGRKRTLPRRFVYCCGSLLRTIQLAEIFSESKAFIDMKMKFPVHDVLMNYEKMVNTFGKHQPTVEALRDFVSEHFQDAKELEMWAPPDWKQSPHILNRISEDKLRKWAIEMNGEWKYLGRKVAPDVIQHPELYSIIAVPHGFVISGEKVRELYYWDSYWIVKGLLKCNMWDTAKDVIKNLLYLVEKYSYVPSGNRIYYRLRSQPPLLTLMMEAYYNHTKDLEFLKKNMAILEKEMDYWKKNRSIIVRKNGFEYHMFQYNVKTTGPRPEEFRTDVQSGIMTESDKELEQHFTSLKSASESGWCLSSRWFVFRGYNHGNRSNIHTQSIVPVDLNAIIHRNYVLFSKWHQILGDKAGAKKYERNAENLLKSIEVVLWNEEIGMWLDYDLSNNLQRNYFYLSNLVPLWTKSYRQNNQKLTEHVIKYLNKNKVHKFPETILGGVPASLEDTGELWDFPNCWPPLQAFLIQGLDRLGNRTASQLALYFAQKFINNCYNEYRIHGTTLNYYDCLGSRVNLEEGSNQGRGWSNGFIFELLDRWGEQLTTSDEKISKTFIIKKDFVSLKK